MPIPTYAEIIELLKKGSTIEAQEKIMALREAVMSLQEENLELRTQLQKLKASNEIDELMQFTGTVYQISSDSKKSGIYCPTCYDKDKKLIRLQTTRENNGFIYICEVCEFMG